MQRKMNKEFEWTFIQKNIQVINKHMKTCSKSLVIR